MKIFEIVLIAAYVLAGIGTLLDIPASEPVMVLVFIILGLSYFAFSWLLFKKKIELGFQNSYIFSGLTGVILALVITGSVFRQMMWPGSMVMLMAGLFLLLIICIPFSIYKIKENELSKYYKGMLIRFLIIGMIGVVWFAIPGRILLEHKEHKLSIYE
ncbi:MAG: hypothetical protein ACK4ND_00075 [Cytophagaceae bacterium]